MSFTLPTTTSSPTESSDSTRSALRTFLRSRFTRQNLPSKKDVRQLVMTYLRVISDSSDIQDWRAARTQIDLLLQPPRYSSLRAELHAVLAKFDRVHCEMEREDAQRVRERVLDEARGVSDPEAVRLLQERLCVAAEELGRSPVVGAERAVEFSVRWSVTAV